MEEIFNNKGIITVLNNIKKNFEITERLPDQIGPLKLAYLGDAVYELIIRTVLMDERERPVKKMNKKAQSLVNATTQAEVAVVITDDLSEEEKAVFLRGRNAKSSSVSKHSDIHDYRIATGLESLFGYLYLKDDMERAVELVKIAFDRLNLDI